MNIETLMASLDAIVAEGKVKTTAKVVVMSPDGITPGSFGEKLVYKYDKATHTLTLYPEQILEEEGKDIV